MPPSLSPQSCPQAIIHTACIYTRFGWVKKWKRNALNLELWHHIPLPHSSHFRFPGPEKWSRAIVLDNAWHRASICFVSVPMILLSRLPTHKHLSVASVIPLLSILLLYVWKWLEIYLAMMFNQKTYILYLETNQLVEIMLITLN